MNKMNEYKDEFWSHFEVVNSNEELNQYQSFPCRINQFQEECIKTALFNASGWLDLPEEKLKEYPNTFHIKTDVGFN